MQKLTIVLFCLGASVMTAQAPKVETRVEVRIISADNARGNELQREVFEALRRAGLRVAQGETVVRWREGGESGTHTEAFSVWVER